jgi:nucleoid DNA-binding protein
MTKKEIAKKISAQYGVTRLLALEAVQMVFDGITETLVAGGRIELRNFGVFAVRRRRARKARNPRTGESVSVPEKMVVTFKPGMEMGEKVTRMMKLTGGEA